MGLRNVAAADDSNVDGHSNGVMVCEQDPRRQFWRGKGVLRACGRNGGGAL